MTKGTTQVPLKVSTWRVPMNSPIKFPIEFASCIEQSFPDQLPIDFKKDSFGFHMGIDNERSRPISNNSLRFPMGINHELSRPISSRFERHSFEFSYGH